MRGILWRGLAVALACCVSWLLWSWPEPQPAEPVEFVLVECTGGVPMTAEQLTRCDSATYRP